MPPVDWLYRRQIDREGGPVRASDPPDSSRGRDSRSEQSKLGCRSYWTAHTALQVCAWFAVRGHVREWFSCWPRIAARSDARILLRTSPSILIYRPVKSASHAHPLAASMPELFGPWMAGGSSIWAALIAQRSMDAPATRTAGGTSPGHPADLGPTDLFCRIGIATNAIATPERSTPIGTVACECSLPLLGISFRNHS